MKKFSLFSLILVCNITIMIAGGDGLTGSSNTTGASASQTDTDNNKDQTIITGFLDKCRNPLQEVAMQLGRLDQATKTIILNSPCSEVYTKGLHELDVVSSWAQKDPHTVAVLIASISQKR